MSVPDPLQERVAQVLMAAYWDNQDQPFSEQHRGMAAAVLADLRETGELRACEPCDLCKDTGWVDSVRTTRPVLVPTADHFPCPRGCKPEGETPKSLK